MYWSNFFHIYQPFDQRKEILARIVNESYRPLIAGWLENPRAHITLNINACLTENLYRNGFKDVINNLATLALRGQLEFTSSGKFHPFLPILPKSEITRQILLNDETNQKYFGKAYTPQGFFPPEMGYNRVVGEVVRDLGYKWIVLDEIAFNGKIDEVKYDRLYQLSLRAREARRDNLLFGRGSHANFSSASDSLAKQEIGLTIKSKSLAIGEASKNLVASVFRARRLLDQALSCNHMWWSNPDAWWSIEEIEKGAYNLKKAICTLQLTIVSNNIHAKAEKLYQKIMAQAFAWQRQGLPQKLHEEKEKFKKIPFKDRAKPGEFDALIAILKEEEKKASERYEYELAIRWRDSRYKLEKGLDVYDYVHIVDQMRAEGKMGKYEELAKKFRTEYKKYVPGQADK